ncbi:hypothetical protein BD770DRAFT_442374 [Pilaira anomala]|nr:hypothetical protein BD770DRAFT_442374 [Pilaira anomala]
MFSKTKVENMLGLFFNTLNLTFYLVTMTSAAMKIRLTTDKNVSHILTCLYALLGGIIFSLLHPFILFTASADLIMGLVYMLLSFFPSTPFPRTMIENWQNWQEYSAEGLDLDRPERKNNDVDDDNAARLRKSMLETPPRSKSNSPA